MAAYLPENAKLGSLFDGIGGFPLCWERTHGKGTARWASEIEEFPIAVTKYHFPENNSGENAKFGMSVEENIQPPIVAKVTGGVSGPSVVQGFDAYNQAITGDVAMPLRNKAADSDHIPVVCLDDK
jgi:site-specific DNA-cytosine methylase